MSEHWIEVVAASMDDLLVPIAYTVGGDDAAVAASCIAKRRGQIGQRYRRIPIGLCGTLSQADKHRRAPSYLPAAGGAIAPLERRFSGLNAGPP